MLRRLKATILAVFRKREGLRIIFLLSPSVGWYLLLLIVPLGIMLLYSFWTLQSGGILTKTFTLSNYIEVALNPVYRGLLIKSIGMALCITVVSVVLAYIVAYYLALKVRKKYQFSLLFLLWGPFLCSYLLIVFAWKLILGYSGVLNSLLLSWGLIEQPITFFMYSLFAVILTLVHIWTPWLVYPIFVSLEKIDRPLLEAAEVLGANPIRRFLEVTLPISMPGVFVAILFVFIPTVGEFITPMLVGGTEGLMFGNALSNLFMRGYNWPLGSALTFVMLITVMMALTILLRKITLERLMESL